MKYRLIVAATIIGLLGLVSAFAYAQGTPVPTETPVASSVIQQDIFVRGGPGRDYLPVGKLLAGDHVRPLSRNAQGDWVLIVYGKGYGWIRRDLAFWVENVDALPVIDVANLTPTPVLPTTPSSTPVLLPTFTPVGNWVQLGNDAQSGFVRAGPGRTYLRLGQLFTGDSVEPVSQNADGSWIMIRYAEGFGWISRNLVLWVDNLDNLPVVSVDNLTPSATFTATNTATNTPTATYTSTPTSTPSVTPTFTASYTLTSTPSATFTLTSTLTATLVPSATNTLIPTNTSTVTPTETLIPTVEPSATSTPSATITSTATLVPTVEPTSTPTATETLIPTIEPSATSTPSATASYTATLVPTVEPTSTPTITSTAVPSETPIIVEAAVEASATVELQPTQTSTVTVTSSPIPPTNTERPAPTHTPTVTVTATVTPVPPTQTEIPSATFTATELPATAISITNTSVPSATSVVSTNTVSVPTVSVSPTATATTEETRVAGALSAPTSTPNPAGGSAPNGGLSPEVLIAGIVLLAILVYAFFYWRGISGSERYASGFVIETCPVCQKGHLIVESRQERLVGIPRARHSVRCSECRSVLREVSDHQWRYAVDPVANPDLYQRFNGKVIDEQTLIDLSHEQTGNTSQRGTSAPSTPPDFVDDDT